VLNAMWEEIDWTDSNVMAQRVKKDHRGEWCIDGGAEVYHFRR
jgi:hypothetical protein